MKVVFDSRWTGTGGIARFSAEVRSRISGCLDLPRRVRLFSPWSNLEIRRFVRRVRPDAWFSPGFNPPPRIDLPFVFTIHDLNYVLERSVSDPLRRAYFQAIVRPACARAAFVTTPSEYSRRRIVEWAPVADSRVVCVGAGVAGAFRPSGPVTRQDKPYFLYVGNRLAHKDLPTLVTGFAASGLAAEFRLVLTGQPDVVLADLAGRYGVGGSMAFAGDPNESQLASLYRGATALVLPSRAEGFGLPAVESMACGTPVVLARAGSLPEVAGDAGLYFEPGDPDELAELLRKLAGDTAVRHHLAQRGLNRATKYSWQATADSILKLLGRAVSE